MPFLNALRSDPTFKDSTDEDLLLATQRALGISAEAAADTLGLGNVKGGVTSQQVSSSIDRYQAGLYGVGEAIAEGVGAKDSAAFLKRQRESNEFNADLAANRARQQGAVDSWENVHGVGDFGSYAKGLGIQSAPYAVEAIAGGLGARAAMTGTRAALAGAKTIEEAAAAKRALNIGSEVGGVAASYPSAVGDVLQNQREQSPTGETRGGVAAALAVPYAALNAFGVEGALMKGNAFKNTVNILDRGTGLTGAAARTAATATGVAFKEGASETGQEMLNQVGRMSVDSNEDFLSAAAQERFKESFIGGAVLGGALGGAAGGWRRSSAGGNDISQAMGSKDEAQPDVTTQQFQEPMGPMPPTEMVGPAPQAFGPQMPAPAVAGGSTDIALSQQQAQQEQAQRQAAEAQHAAREEFTNRFGGVRHALDEQGNPTQSVVFQNQTYHTPEELNAALDKMVAKDKTPDNFARLVQAAYVATHQTPEKTPAVSSVISQTARYTNGAASLLVAANRINTEIATLVAQGKPTTDTKLTKLAEFYENLTGEVAPAYTAAEQAQPKGKQDDRLQLQTDAGLREVSVQGGTGETSVGGNGPVRPTEVQPVGTGSVGAGPLNIQAGQPPAGGVRPSPDAGTDIGVSNDAGSREGQGQVNVQATNVQGAQEDTGERRVDEDSGAVSAIQQEQAIEEQAVEEVPNLIRSALRMIYKSDRKVDLLLRLTEKTQRGDYAELAKEYEVSEQYVKELASDAITDKGQAFPRFIMANLDKFMAAVNFQAEKSGISVLEALDALSTIHDAYEGGLASQLGTEVNEGDLINAGMEIQNVKERKDKAGKGTGKVDRTNVSDLAEEGKTMEALMQQYVELADQLEAANEANDDRVEDLKNQVAELTKKIAEAEKKEKTRVREMTSKQAPKETENAVQVESTDEGDVREPAGGGEEVGQANAEPQKLARKGKQVKVEPKQEEVIQAPQEQYEALAAETPLLPPYESLDARERDQIADQAHQGKLTLASLNTMFGKNAKFGKAAEAKNPYTAAELTKEISDFTRTAVNTRKLVIVDSVEQLLRSSNQEEQRIGAVLALEGAYGVAINGKAYLIADRIEKGRGRAKFMHEVGTHIGLENLLPKAMYNRLVGQIKKWAASDLDTDEVTLAARAEMRVLSAKTPKADYDAELLAYFIEEAVQAGIDPTASGKESSALRDWFRTLWAAFKVAVRKLGYNPDSMTAQDVVDMAFGAARLEMSGTYHGTAASFRNFRNKYIGTGEGATAYGWGTYLAERYGIAKGYHEADVRRKTKGAVAKPEGNLMRVDTSVTDDELFNYNATVADQPQQVKDAIKSMLDPIADEVLDRTNSDVDELTGRDLFGTGENDLGLLSQLIMDDVLVANGDKFNKAVQQGEFHKAASLLLEEAGIAGIKHLDARSRGTATKVIQFKGKSYNRDELRDAARAAYAAKDDQLTFEMGMLRSLLQNGIEHVRAMHKSKQAYYERLFYKTDKESAERFKVPFSEEEARADAKRRTKDLFETKALNWLDAHEAEISLAENPRTYNHILFSDKNIFRVGSQVAADKNRMRFGKETAQPQGMFSKAGTWMDSVLTNPKEAFHKLKLGFLTLDQLAELDKTPGQVVRAYSDVMTAMQKLSKDSIYKASQIDLLWAKLSNKESEALSKVMRDATRAQFDPSLGVAAKNDVEAGITNEYRALSPSARDVYAKVKKHYEDAFKARLAIMEDSAAKLGGKELKEIQQLYAKVKGPYFPLGRTGKYYAVGMSARVSELTDKKEAGTIDRKEARELVTLRRQESQYQTHSFDTLAEAKKKSDEMQASMGYAYYNEAEERISTELANRTNFAKLEESITTQLGGETRAEVKSMLSQLMFDALPEHHALKRQMKREGIHGEDKDMRRVFAQTAISQAHYISRLKFSNELDQAMRAVGKTASRDIEMRQIQNELKLRTKLSMDNTQSALVDSMINASYFAHLGLSPAFLLTNMTQVPMITAPWLGARHGVGATKRAMAMALADTAKIIKTSFKDGDWRSEINWNSLFPVGSNEDRMFHDLLDRNVLDITMEHDLAAVASAQKGIFDDKISKATGGKLGGMSDVVKLVNTPVRVTELANRAVTALSAYRMKMESLASAPMTAEERHEAAVNYAARAVSETQLNYSELNAPRHMRQVLGSKPLAKMIFQFRKYQQGMLYLIAKNISDALPNSKATAEDRRIARRTIAGLYITTGLMAGTSGMPLMGTVGLAGIANLLAAAFGDDDEPWDFETEYRNFLTDWLGHDAALLVAKGIPAALGADISQRVGMGDIANPIPFVQRGATGQSTIANAMYAAGGAPVGMVGNMYDGIVAMANGDVMKGMEKVIPVKAVKDALRTYRYADEGMTDKRGNVILPPEKFDAWDLTLRGMGFTPTKESEYYAANAAMQEAKTAATDVRTRLLRDYSEAKMKGEPTTDVDAQIADFNERHPEKSVKIDMSTKLKAVQARRKMAAERTESGLRVGKYEKPFASAARFATEE